MEMNQQTITFLIIWLSIGTVIVAIPVILLIRQIRKRCSICGTRMKLSNQDRNKLSDGEMCWSCQHGLHKIGHDTHIIVSCREVMDMLDGKVAPKEYSSDEKIQIMREQNGVQNSGYVFPKRIKRATILGASGQKSAGSAITRGAVGGALFGPIGAIGGAMSGKSKGYVDVLVEYSNGTFKTFSCHPTSTRFKELAPYLDK